MRDASKCGHLYVLWSLLAPGAPPSTCAPAECGSSPSGGRPMTREGRGAAWLKAALEMPPLSGCPGLSVSGPRGVWLEPGELPYCFESVVSDSSLGCDPGWLVPAACCSGQWSPAVLSL